MPKKKNNNNKDETDLHENFLFSVFIYRFFTGLSLRSRADISKVTAHERILTTSTTDLSKF
jgi:hypothetical protein